MNSSLLLTIKEEEKIVMDTCIRCNQDIAKIATDRLDAKGKVIFKDESDRQWTGAVCPECYSKINKKPKVEKSKNDRKCRNCGGKLSDNRYFNCEDCQVELPEDPGEWTYSTFDF